MNTPSLLSLSAPKSPAGASVCLASADLPGLSVESDGFSSLLDQLAALLPPPSSAALPAVRQIAALPTGKSLPLDPAGAPIEGGLDVFDEALPDLISAEAPILLMLPLPVEAGTAQPIEAGRTHIHASPRETALPVARLTVTTAGNLDKVVTENGASSPEGLTVRISAAPSSSTPSSPGLERPLPVSAASAPRAEPGSKEGVSIDTAKTLPLNAAAIASVRTGREQVARQAEHERIGAEASSAPRRVEMPAAPATARAADPAIVSQAVQTVPVSRKPAAARLLDAATLGDLGPRPDGIAFGGHLASGSERSAQASIGSASTITSAAIENVERIVDQLSTARQFDLAKGATVALAHREFGELKVTFETVTNGLEVEVSADDANTQRALAAAMHSDRAQLRPADATFAPAHQAAPGASERGAAGQSGGSGLANTNSQSAGEGTAHGERNAQSQRGRDTGRATGERAAANPATGDGALYA